AASSGGMARVVSGARDAVFGSPSGPDVAATGTDHAATVLTGNETGHPQAPGLPNAIDHVAGLGGHPAPGDHASGDGIDPGHSINPGHGNDPGGDGNPGGNADPGGTSHGSADHQGTDHGHHAGTSDEGHGQGSHQNHAGGGGA